MSALGQKRTCAVHQPVSALPQIATSIAFFGMSAFGHKRTTQPEWYQTAVTTICARAVRVFRHTKRMSALGQKQNICSAKGHVRFTPIATAKADTRKRSCLLYPQKRTCAAQLGMSSMGQKRIAPAFRSQNIQKLNRCLRRHRFRNAQFGTALI